MLPYNTLSISICTMLQPINAQNALRNKGAALPRCWSSILNRFIRLKMLYVHRLHDVTDTDFMPN